jgi:hypothetical protein
MQDNTQIATLDAPTCSSILDVMSEYPELTYFGFGKINGLGERWKTDEFSQQRKELESASEQVEASRAWIRMNCVKRKTINALIGSYSLKHVIEDAVNLYISNGACIAAFILEGYRVQHLAGWGPNCAFNVKFPITHP